MANPLIGEILRGALGGALGGRTGGLGGGVPGGLGSVLGGMLGGGLPGARPTGVPVGARGGNRSAMLMLLLPLVMSWIQRNGGIGSVLSRARQQGYGGHADSWIGTGGNEPLPPDAAHRLLGDDELASLSAQLGVGQDEAAQGFAEVLPEVVDQLSPQGQLADDADRQLDAGQAALDRMLQQAP